LNTLLGEQRRLKEEQQVFQEQLRDSEHIQSELKARLTTSEERGSRAAQVLSARAKHLYNALQDEKDKSKQQKKKLKANIAQVNSVTKETLQQEKEAQRVERMKLLQEAEQEMLIAKDQCNKKTTKTLLEKSPPGGISNPL